ncbi:MAG: tetratricopeptide repeat protein [Chloroflexi bacterium]|nr:tetratricopeptide repeat protein [Chloroflexota bacterium]
MSDAVDTAAALLHDGDFDAALTVLNTALAADPDDIAARRLRAETLTARSTPQSLKAALADFDTLPDPTADDALLVALVYERLDVPDAALDHLERAVEQWPGHARLRQRFMGSGVQSRRPAESPTGGSRLARRLAHARIRCRPHRRVRRRARRRRSAGGGRRPVHDGAGKPARSRLDTTVPGADRAGARGRQHAPLPARRGRTRRRDRRHAHPQRACGRLFPRLVAGQARQRGRRIGEGARRAARRQRTCARSSVAYHRPRRRFPRPDERAIMRAKFWPDDV